MATERRRRRAAGYPSRGYSTYGSVAYQPEYEEHTAQSPVRREEPHRRPRIRPRDDVATRPVVEVRQQLPISPFAVVGFAAVILSVMLLLSTAIQLSVVADKTFDLQSELTTLQNEEKKLLAQYELAYDLSAIERQMTSTGAMVRAGAADTVYLELTETDSVTYFSKATAGIPGLVDRIEDMIGNVLSFGHNP